MLSLQSSLRTVDNVLKRFAPTRVRLTGFYDLSVGRLRALVPATGRASGVRPSNHSASAWRRREAGTPEANS